MSELRGGDEAKGRGLVDEKMLFPTTHPVKYMLVTEASIPDIFARLL